MSAMARRVTRARPGVGSSGMAWYRTAPPEPNRHPFDSHPSISEDLHGPFLRHLRQGLDRRLQSPVVRFEPRPRAPSLPAEPPGVHDRPERHCDEGARLHALPPHGDEVRPLTLAKLVSAF